jgi:malate permease and related proteins
VSLVLLAATLAAGLVVQRLHPRPWVLRVTWGLYFWTITPALVFYSFSTVTFDRDLTLALAAAVLAGWLVIAIALGYARAVSEDPAERGTLALAAGFGNTGFVGYPLAQLLYGTDGLALMVVYDRIGLVVPGLAVTTAIARHYGRRAAGGEAQRWWVAAFANPPLVAMALAIVLRLAGVDVPGIAHVADIGGAIVGPAGFFLLGLSLPLERVAHGAGELLRASGVLAIRFGVSPLVLVACGLALGAEIPRVFLLAAALPCPFHLLILARVFGLRPALMRLLVVASTIPAVVIVAGIALF